MTTPPGGMFRPVSFMDKCYEKKHWSLRELSSRSASSGQAGPRFTGKQLENRIAEMVQQANAQLQSNAPEAGVELSYQDYQRGLFSSHPAIGGEAAGR